MEELLAYALLMTEGLLPWEAYQEMLHALFLQEPGNELLMDLECEKGTLIYIQRYFNYGCPVFDRTAFGTALMGALGRAYEDCADLRKFSTKAYALWNILPADLQFEQPFWPLSYGDDCLDGCGEKEARALYEEAFGFYQKTN